MTNHEQSGNPPNRRPSVDEKIALGIHLEQEEWENRFGNGAYKYARFLGASKEDAVDLAADARLDFYKQPDQLERKDAVGLTAWLKRVVFNKRCNNFRKSKRQVELSSPMEGEPMGDEGIEAIMDDRFNTEDFALASYLNKSYKVAVLDLKGRLVQITPRTQRESIIVLTDYVANRVLGIDIPWQGSVHEEIARRLGRKTSAVGMHIKRGKPKGEKILWQVVEDRGLDEHFAFIFIDNWNLYKKKD